MGEFGGELARWMQARNAGVRELARRSGYTASYISQLRGGKRMPSPHAAADLDDALGAGGALAAAAPVPAREAGRPAARPDGLAAQIAAILAVLIAGTGPGVARHPSSRRHSRRICRNRTGHYKPRDM